MQRTGVNGVGVGGVMVRMAVLAVVVLLQGCTLPLVPIAAVYRPFLPECGKNAPKGEACTVPLSWKRAVFGAWTRADSLEEETTNFPVGDEKYKGGFLN